MLLKVKGLLKKKLKVLLEDFFSLFFFILLMEEEIISKREEEVDLEEMECLLEVEEFIWSLMKIW